MILLVTGERDWSNDGSVERALERIRRGNANSSPLFLVLGDCPHLRDESGKITRYSVDELALTWARESKVQFRQFVADWESLGNRAGPVRNGEMVKFVAAHNDPNKLAIALWSGRTLSSGTLSCFSQATVAGIPVRIVPKARPT